jgi:hypothetical protein
MLLKEHQRIFGGKPSFSEEERKRRWAQIIEVILHDPGKPTQSPSLQKENRRP